MKPLKQYPTFDDSEAFGQNCNVFISLSLFHSPLSRNSQKRLERKENQTKYGKMTKKPGSHVRILIY